MANAPSGAPPFVGELSKRISWFSYAGFCAAALQLIAAIVLLVSLLGPGGQLLGFFFAGAVIFLWLCFFLMVAAAVVNALLARRAFALSKSILSKPAGITGQYVPMGAALLGLVCNGIALIFCFISASGNVFGIIATLLAVLVYLFNLLYVRPFVIQNQAQIEQLEKQGHY